MKNINPNVQLSADDTSLYIIVDNLNETAQTANDDLSNYKNWKRHG